MTVPLSAKSWLSGLPSDVLDQFLGRSADLFEDAMEQADVLLETAEELLEQPEVRALAVGSLVVVLMAVVALLFFVRNRALRWAPIGVGLESITLLVLGCLAMAFIEVQFRPSYLVKCICKITLFVACIFLYQLTNPGVSMLGMFRVKKPRQLLGALGGGLLVYAFILMSYLLFRDYVDLRVISASLTGDSSINRDNFLIVALYVSFFNSLLEEIFFRGFAFLSLREQVPERYAHAVSALAFSLYHFAIMANWFSLWIFLLLLVSLFVAGLLFNWVDSKSGNIYNSWLIHMFANFSINTIGLLMFGLVPMG